MAERSDCVRLVLCDPHGPLRAQLRALVQDDPGVPCLEVVGEAGDGQEAIHVTRECAPDVAIVELWLPKLDGMQAIPLMRRACSGTAIVVYSAATSPNLQQLCRSLGADAFVDKGAPTQVLLTRVRELAGSRTA